MAEAILLHKVQARGLEDLFEVDSAGTGDWHVGDRPDPRTISTLESHGIRAGSNARQLKSSDFETFDHIIVMDSQNYLNVCAWSRAKPEKVSLALFWDPSTNRKEVPDPYYGEMEGFEEVFELLDSSCEAILEKMVH